MTENLLGNQTQLISYAIKIIELENVMNEIEISICEINCT